MSAHPPHAPLAPASPTKSLSGILRVPEHRAIGRLSALIGDVVDCLDAPGGALGAAISRCHAGLEVCLELQRDLGEREDLVAHARDDLKRLQRLLTVVDRTDVPFIIRQIRRVLGRFDGHPAARPADGVCV